LNIIFIIKHKAYYKIIIDDANNNTNSSTYENNKQLAMIGNNAGQKERDKTRDRPAMKFFYDVIDNTDKGCWQVCSLIIEQKVYDSVEETIAEVLVNI
jgi:hypothetical protein